MTELAPGYSDPTNPDHGKTPDTGPANMGEAHNVQDTPPIQGGGKLGPDSLTPHEALGGIHPDMQDEAQKVVAASRAEAVEESWTDRLKRNKVARAIGGTVAVLLVAGGAALGVTKAMGGHDDNPAPKPQVTNSAPGVLPSKEVPPSASTSIPPSAPSTIETPTAPSTTETISTFPYAPENPALIATIDSYVTLGQTDKESQAGVVKYEKLTVKQRASWYLSKLNLLAQAYNGQVVLDNDSPEKTPYTFGKVKSGAEKRLMDYNPIKSEVDDSGGAQYTEKSTPTEAFGIGLLARNMTGSFLLLDAEGRPTPYNKYYGSMLVGGEVAADDPKTSHEYRDKVDSALHSNTHTALKQKQLDTYTVLDGSDLYPVTLDKETYKGMTITYEVDDNKTDHIVEVYKVKKVFIPMPEELGKDKNGLDCGIWETLETTHVKTKIVK